MGKHIHVAEYSFLPSFDLRASKNRLAAPLIEFKRRVLLFSSCAVLSICDYASGEALGSEEKEYKNNFCKSTLVVLMVGGQGSRLLPLTESCPKSMLPVNGEPLLETTVKKLRDQGFRKILMATGFQSEKIEAYFGNGSQLSVEISYIRERESLGTCGALALLPVSTGNLLVINGDIITDLDFNNLLQFHENSASALTVCVRPYEIQIPYGVVESQGQKLLSFQEKPIQKHWINMGIYALTADCLKLIPSGRPYDMPDLIKQVCARQEAAVYPTMEQWLDIGSLDDYCKANGLTQDSLPLSSNSFVMSNE
jgi:NDP-sugar pyrophosphorylase family protein